MCGIFGVLAEHYPTKGQENFLFDAMQTGQVRGLHGSGMFTVNKDMNIKSCALALPGTAFLMDQRSEDVRRSVQMAKLVVGHNRYTTSGDNVDAHCHPFRFDSVIGVHNGMVPEHILNRIDPDRSHEVDSARVFAALSKAADPIEVLEKINGGAYCLVWADTRTKSMYIARNDARPLFVAETSSGLFFASELGMLTWLLGRHNFGGNSPVPISGPDKMTLYQIPLNTPREVTAEEYKTHSDVVGVSRGNWYGARWNGAGSLIDDDDVDIVSGVPVHRNGPYSGFPNRLKYKVYYSTMTIKYDFPLMTESVDDTVVMMEIEQLNGYQKMYANMCVVGIGKNLYKDTVAYGFLCNKDGTEILYNTLISLRLSTIGEQGLIQDLLEEQDSQVPHDERLFALLRVKVDSFLLRPSGEIVLQSMPAQPLGDPLYADIDDLEYISGVDELGPPWAEEIISDEYMKNATDQRVVDEWKSLSTKGPSTF